MRKKITLLILLTLLFTSFSSVKAEESLPNLVPTALKARIGLYGTDYNLNDTSKSFDVGDSLNITGNYQNLGGSYTVPDPANPFLSNLKITKNGITFLDSTQTSNSGATAGFWVWTPTEAGTYTVFLTLDKNNAINESNENNNTFEKTITIAGLPNLTPTALRARIGLNGTVYNLNDTSKSFDVGDSLNITGNYENSGGSYIVADPANPFLSNLKITKNGKTFFDSNDNANPGAIAGLWDWTPTEAGTYTIFLTLDKNNAISESNETNNTLEKTITITTSSAPSVQPSITSISSNSASVGSSVTINGSNFNLHLPNRVMFSDSHYVNGIPGITYVTGVTSSDGSRVTFIVPNISAIDGWISVVNAVNQQSNSVSFTITAPSAPADQITQITTNANLLINDKMSEILAELNQLRSIVKEQQTQIIYLSSLLKDVQGISAASQAVLNNFITYGVDANTVKLGAGERAAVINSYKAAFDKLPQTEAELADVIKIANGRWPSITNKDAENKAKAQFQKIYKRIADMNNASDNAAVTVMAYGLRQKAENRNLNSEVNGIKIFKAIYGHTPNSTEDWNIMQAITYSGASR